MKQKNIRLITVFILANMLMTSLLMAQDKRISIRTNAGVVSLTDVTPDGYYYSFDIGIPLFKYLEIAPTFISASAMPNGRSSFYWRTYPNAEDSVPHGTPSGSSDNHLDNHLYSSVGLILYFKPLTIEKKANSKKKELLVGVGLSYGSYTTTYRIYEIKNGESSLFSFNQTSHSKFSPTIFKISYNVYFKENAFYGLVTGLNATASGVFFLGLQLGVKL